MDADTLRDPLLIAERWLAEERGVTLVAVMPTRSPAPRTADSQMVVRDDGEFAGSVTAGCAEGAVIEVALAGCPAKRRTVSPTTPSGLRVLRAAGESNH